MRSKVQISPGAAVYQCQLSMPSLQGWLMSSSLQATGEGLANPADLGGGIFVILHRGSNSSLSQTATKCATVPLAYVNQLPLPRL